MKVAIFVDRADQSLSRFCYWLRYFESQSIEPRLVSIPDRRDLVHRANERHLPRLDDYDLIILNWDVANGDYAFRADETLQYFQSRGRAELRRWAGRGSRILVEVQSAGGRPLQEVYDALLGEDEVMVCAFSDTSADVEAEDALIRNRRRKSHPVVADLERPDERIETKYRHFDHVVLPGFDKTSESQFSMHQRMLSWGHFRKWRRGWIPLILRPDGWKASLRPRPTALALPVGTQGGELIVTTMRAANSGNHDLLDALTRVSPASRKQARRFYGNAAALRIALRCVGVGVLWVIGLTIVLPGLAWAASKADAQFPSWAKATLQSARIPEQVRTLGTELAGVLKPFDVTAIAVILGLTGLTRRFWKLSDRL